MERKNAIQMIEKVVQEISKVIIGRDKEIRKIIMALLADGHILVDGVPGLAKTLTVMSLGKAFNATFRRIQMVPDMLPSDVIGTYIWVGGRFQIQHGPLFNTNLILADEINRAPTKTQAALLEAMQERQVTPAGRETFPLLDPFMVLATMNPIEQEGTYPLPEAEVDRFMMKIPLDYTSEDEEKEILKNTNLDRRDKIRSIVPTMTMQDLVDIREEIKSSVVVGENAIDFITKLVRETRTRIWEGENVVKLGGSPRAELALRDLSRVRAYLADRNHVIPEDIVAFFPDVMRHRIILEITARAKRWTVEDILWKVQEKIKPA